MNQFFTRAKRLIYSAAAICIVLVVLLGALRLFKSPLSSGGPYSQAIPFSKAIYDQEGKLLRLTLTSDEKYRLWTPLSEISGSLIAATLLLEDKHFRSHFGFNPWSLVRAFWATYIRQGKRMGGSTLSMQLARIKFGLYSKNLTGKLMQILRSIQLETLYTKNEILEAYLNLVPYGGNIEGVGAASLVYFHKDAIHLAEPEALTLAVIPQNPAKRSPDRDGVSHSLSKARDSLLNLLGNSMGKIGREAEPSKDPEAAKAFQLPIHFYRSSQLPFLAPHFTEQILREERLPDRVRTTLNLGLQKILERQAKNYIESHKAQGLKNAAALLVDFRTMEVKASLGSGNFFDDSISGQVDGTLAKRSPGSALKPFVYGLGIDQGLIHPMSILKDSPMSFGGFDPENFDGDFVGPVSVKDALIHSRNIPAVNIASQLKSPSLYSFLQSAGVSRLKTERFYGLALALGGAEVTLEELATLYGMLANGGVLKPLKRYVDLIHENNRKEAEKRLLSPEASFLVMDMLKENLRPEQEYRQDWVRDSLPVHWKTGTSHGFRDAWAAGVFGPYVLVVWMGNFSGEGNPALIGREAAGPLFFQIVDAVKSFDRHVEQVPIKGVHHLTHTRVCAVSGSLPGPYCNHKVSTWFIPGKSPIKTCEIHRQIAVSVKTGRRLCSTHALDLLSGSVKNEVYEFWPSDLLKLFKQAGVPRRTPPAYEANCPAANKGDGRPPLITSPKEQLVYALRSSQLKNEAIFMAATTEADTRQLFWFVDDQFIGKTESQRSLSWKPRPGHFLVRVVDDQGRSDSRELEVTLAD